MSNTLTWEFHGTEKFGSNNKSCTANPRDERFIPYAVDWRINGDFCLSVSLSIRGNATMADAQALAQKIEDLIREQA